MTWTTVRDFLDVPTTVNPVTSDAGAKQKTAFSRIAEKVQDFAISVRDPLYGAAGDGTTDDAADINAAITAANAAGGGTVFFPPGRTYAAGSTIINKDGVVLYGYGAVLKWIGSTSGTIIQCGEPDPAFRQGIFGLRVNPQTSFTGKMLVMRSAQLCVLRDMEFDNASATATGMEWRCDTTNSGGLYNSRHSFFNVCENVTFNALGTGAVFVGITDNPVTDNRFENLRFADTRVKGIRFLEWSDNNHFHHTYVGLTAADAEGIIFNDTATPTAEVATYANVFDGWVGIDIFGAATGRVGVRINYSKRSFVKHLHIDPLPSGCFDIIDTNNPLSSDIELMGPAGTGESYQRQREVYRDGPLRFRVHNTDDIGEPSRRARDGYFGRDLYVAGSIIGAAGGQSYYAAVVPGDVYTNAIANAAAINAAITTANANGGGLVIVSGNSAEEVVAYDGTITLKNNVIVRIADGTILRWWGAFNGTMFDSPIGAPLLKSGVVGNVASTVDPALAATTVFDLHSPQLCTFGGFEVGNGKQTTPWTTVIKVRCDVTSGVGGINNSRIAGYNRFLAMKCGICGKLVDLEGVGPDSLVTLNEFDSLDADVSVTGIRFAKWCDNNSFNDRVRIALTENNATGVIYNDSVSTEVTLVTVLTGGTGYSVGNAVTFSGGGASTQATGRVAAVSAGAITMVDITTPGVGYTSNPTATAAVGSGATFAVTRGGAANEAGVYANSFYHLAVDTFAGATGRRGIVFNKTKNNRINQYYNNPSAEGGSIVEAYADSVILTRTGEEGTTDIDTMRGRNTYERLPQSRVVGSTNQDGTSGPVIGGMLDWKTGTHVRDEFHGTYSLLAANSHVLLGGPGWGVGVTSGATGPTIAVGGGASVADHPGHIQFTSLASSSIASYIGTKSGGTLTSGGAGIVQSQSYWDLTWIIRPTLIDATVTIRVGMVIGGQAAATQPTSGIYFEHLIADGAGSTWFMVTRNSGTQTRTAFAGVTLANATWYRLRIRRARKADGTDRIAFSVDDRAEVEVNTNIVPSGTLLMPFVELLPSTAAAKSVDIDFFDLTTYALAR